MEQAISIDRPFPFARRLLVGSDGIGRSDLGGFGFEGSDFGNFGSEDLSSGDSERMRDSMVRIEFDSFL